MLKDQQLETQKATVQLYDKEQLRDQLLEQQQEIATKQEKIVQLQDRMTEWEKGDRLQHIAGKDMSPEVRPPSFSASSQGFVCPAAIRTSGCCNQPHPPRRRLPMPLVIFSVPHAIGRAFHSPSHRLRLSFHRPTQFTVRSKAGRITWTC